MIATVFCSRELWECLQQSSMDLLQDLQDKILRESEDLSIMFK